MTKKDQMKECMHGIAVGMEKIAMEGDIWQHEYLMYVGKALMLLLEREVKKVS